MRVIRRLAAIVCVALLARTAEAANPMDSLARTFDDGAGGTLKYRLFLPPDHDQPGAEFPLVVFLHGAGERGSDNFAQVSVHINGLIDATQSSRFAAYLLAPQVPSNDSWDRFGSANLAPSMDRTLSLIGQLETEFGIDSSRRYVTGLSMGGFGTFDVVSKRPDFFAAAAPLSGGGFTPTAAQFVDERLWAFHGRNDSTVNVDWTRNMIDAIRDAGGSPLYSETDGGHNIWSAIYTDTIGELYPWMYEGVAPPLAPLIYDELTGHVWLDARSAPGGSLTRLSIGVSPRVSLRAVDVPVINGVAATVTATTLTWVASGGEPARGLIDLGEVLQPGYDFLTLSRTLTTNNYLTPLTGLNRRKFDLTIVPEPAGLVLVGQTAVLVGLIASVISRRRMQPPAPISARTFGRSAA
jgi:poly(3-hydroxybutyrate) depolymerase